MILDSINIVSSFTSIVRRMDVPFNYGIFGGNKWLRYPATIYGYNFDKVFLVLIYD